MRTGRKRSSGNKYMNNYFISFRLLTHLGVNNICALGMLHKNRLRKCIITENKQLQKKEHGHFEQRTSSKKKRVTLIVVGSTTGVVYIASFKPLSIRDLPSEKQGRCKLCRKNSKRRCVKCKVNLHDICFEIFHGY